MDESSQSKPKKRLGTRAWQNRVLKCISECGNIAALCRELGIDESNVYRTKQKDPEFAAKWAEAEQRGLDALELEVSRRARTMSDRLAEFILSRKRPAVWGDKTAPNAGQKIDINIEPDEPTTQDQPKPA